MFFKITMYPYHLLHRPGYCGHEGFVGGVRSGHPVLVSPVAERMGRGSLPAMGPSRLQVFGAGVCVWGSTALRSCVRTTINPPACEGLVSSPHGFPSIFLLVYLWMLLAVSFTLQGTSSWCHQAEFCLFSLAAAAYICLQCWVKLATGSISSPYWM